jgi:pimeloyl-ACP methyl ester carboxylesterase
MRARFWQSVRTGLKVLGVLSIVALVVGFGYEEVGRRRDRARLPRIGEGVDIGGRRVNLSCSGAGEPVVVILTGNTQPGYAWSHIQPQIATHTRACWIDRPGEGWSDPGPFPRTGAATMTDVHQALVQARIAPPYVLVGHSLGGLEARIFSGLYPTEVAGLVLADAAHEEEPRRAPPAYLGRTVPRAWRRPVHLLVSAAGRFGVIRLLSPAPALAADPAQRTRRQVVRALAAQPPAVVADLTGGVVAPQSYDEAERSGTLGDRPLIVLTRGKQPDGPPQNEIDRQGAVYEQVWRDEIQASLARLSTQGTQRILERSGHMIPEEAPEAIVDAVRTVVDAVRAKPAVLVQRPPEPEAVSPCLAPRLGSPCR